MSNEELKDILTSVRDRISVKDQFICNILEFRQRLPREIVNETLDYLKPIAIELGLDEKNRQSAWIHKDRGVNRHDGKYVEWKQSILDEAIKRLEQESIKQTR